MSVTQVILPASLGQTGLSASRFSIRDRAVFRLHFVVPKNDRHRVFTLAINVRRLPHNRRVLGSGRGRLTQNRFHLLLRHAFRDLIHVRLRDSLADATVEHEHEHQHEHQL